MYTTNVVVVVPTLIDEIAICRLVSMDCRSRRAVAINPPFYKQEPTVSGFKTFGQRILPNYSISFINVKAVIDFEQNDHFGHTNWWR